MSIIISDVSYHYFNQHTLFESVSFSVSKGGKVSLIGNNGVGKINPAKVIGKENLCPLPVISEQNLSLTMFPSK